MDSDLPFYHFQHEPNHMNREAWLSYAGEILLTINLLKLLLFRAFVSSFFLPILGILLRLQFNFKYVKEVNVMYVHGI